MKKITVLFAVAVLLFSQGAAWAVWEGNAGVGSAGNFPGSGMYALSDMFPKNTLVDIQNLETGLSVRAVVVGLSGVPVLVASVSPEVAESLNIKEGSVSRVRISVPSDTEEIPVREFASEEYAGNDGIDTVDPDLNPEAFVAAETPSREDLAAYAAATENNPLTEEETASAEPSVENVEDPAVAAETQAAEPSGEIEEEPVIIAEPAAQENPEVAEVTEVPEVEPTAEPLPSDPVVGDEPAVAVVPPLEEETESEVIPEDEVVMEVDEIALVPAEMNPPPSEPAAADENVPEVELISPPVVQEDPVEVTEPVPETASVPPAEVEKDEPDSWISEYIPSYMQDNVPDISVKLEPEPSASASASLKKGYYIQIGSYSKDENVRKILDSYGAKYPISCLDSGTQGTKKILVGNLAADETGAVLEFFRKEGFKDAFVYVIN